MNEFAIVSEREAASYPYPYVHVEEDGSFRELNKDEREFLEEKFSPADGARPYVKWSYSQRTPDNKFSGFMPRNKVPSGLVEGMVPKCLPRKSLWQRFFGF